MVRSQSAEEDSYTVLRCDPRLVATAARGEHVPENLRAGNILKLRQDHADLAAATRLVPDVRLAYQRNAAVSPAGPAQ